LDGKSQVTLRLICFTADRDLGRTHKQTKQGKNMSVVTRGVRNAFRSGIRSVAVVLILAISMGLGLSMLLANQAVKDRIHTVKSEVGTTITVNPAGSQGFQGGGEPLTTDDTAKIKSVAHVSAVNETLNLVAQTTGATQGAFRAFGGGQKSGETSLESSITPGTIGKRFQSRSGGSVEVRGGDGIAPPADFKLPVRIIGTSGAYGEDGQGISLTKGRQLVAADTNGAIIGKSLAEKNKLDIDGTFTLYGETFKLVGIFDNGTEFGNDSVYIPLATAQRVSEAGKEISSAVVKVDSVDNLDSTKTAISTALGTDKADVATTEENALTAVESLRTVERVSLIGFVIALAAAAVIILLTMLMIVRERRREIGVLKAIGGSNQTIMSQFVVEALVLVLMSAVVGFGFASVSGNGIARTLVTSNSTSPDTTTSGEGPQRGRGGFRSIRLGGPGAEQKSAKEYVGEVATTVDARTLGIGLGVAVLIAIAGSAVPALLIAKIRPAEVLRSE
jgi:putative ABC transport system permease protein